MSTLYFKCKLKTDVIISQSSATDGHQSTLDFIPGSNFLGIIAKELYDDKKLTRGEQLLLFHTGDVQFGDAHVMNKGIRTLRIPASMYYPKLKSVEEECYIHHAHKHVEGEQLKQCRSGFYAFLTDEKTIHKADIDKSYAIKSAYDYESRRSKDAQMYGYESMEKGLEFLFEVRLSEKALKVEKLICEALSDAHKRVGRSKTAQYGLVEISVAEECQFPKYQSNQKFKDYDNNNIQVVYADSRLIFFDEHTGLPTFQPTPQDLGFSDGEIAWEHCQIRTFQYAPWNGKRMTYDADRCGIEKGSVFVIKGATSVPENGVIGEYKNEGFGKVIYNPSFLEYIDNNLGKARWEFTKKDEFNTTSTELKAGNNSLLKYIKAQKDEDDANRKIFKIVNKFVDENGKRFKGASFAAQWGNIRKIV